MKRIKRFGALGLALAAALGLCLPVAAAEGGERVWEQDLKEYGSYTWKAGADLDRLVVTGDGTYEGQEAVVTIEPGVTGTLVLRDATLGSSDAPAVDVQPGAQVYIELEGRNDLTGGRDCAAIQVGYEEGNLAGVTIGGSGCLYAQGGNHAAGIGGGYDSVVYGNIEIQSGIVEARGGSGGAGIGSARNNQGSGASYKVGATDWGTVSITGGDVSAYGADGGAGIGGGNHMDSGSIVLTGGRIYAEGQNGAGIGTGTGSHAFGKDGTKGPGYYYATVEIGGSAEIEAVGGWLSAGIGGGYCADAFISISGGTIRASGGDGNPNSYYQGAPGIGGGYQGLARLDISGGVIEEAVGGWSAPGIGNGAAALSAKRGADAAIGQADSYVNIMNGEIELAQGGVYAAGIGSGNGGEACGVTISGGTVNAVGGENGGAGIGSGVGKAFGLKYGADTALSVTISGGSVTATGASGASGIGSGADNITAGTVAITGGADVTAFADGAKFAVDTQRGEVARGETSNKLLQGTFLDRGDLKGLTVTLMTGEAADGWVRPGQAVGGFTLPGGYRSFARTVAENGCHLVCEQGNGTRWFVYNVDAADRSETDEGTGAAFTARYDVTDTLSDNYFLYPADLELAADPEPTPSPEPSETPEPTPSPEPSETPAPTPSPEPSETPAPAPSPEPSETPDPGPSADPAPRPEPGPVAEPEPAPAPEVEIVDEDTPLADRPETEPQPEAQPEPDAQPEPGPEEGGIVIVDEDAPLGNLPQTGTAAAAVSPLYTLGALALMASLTAAGLAANGLRKKRDEE